MREEKRGTASQKVDEIGQDGTVEIDIERVNEGGFVIYGVVE